MPVHRFGNFRSLVSETKIQIIITMAKPYLLSSSIRVYLHSVVFLLCAGALQAQVTFTNQSAMLQSIGGTSVANCGIDMNGDGLDDVVRVMGNGIYIDYQQINGTFSPAFFPMSITVSPNWSICAADIDGNGYTDLMLGSGSQLSFVYANDTGTGYTEDVQPEGIFVQRTTFSDIDNDGNLDAFACHDVAQCRPYRNTEGILSYDISLIQTLAVGGNYAAIWVDYDNDWDSDLYITKCRGGAPVGDPQRINLMYRNDGDGVFTSVGPEIGMDDGDQSWSTTFEDFDNDGDFDAFTVNHEWANRYMRNNGDGTFTDIIASTGIDASDLNNWNCDAGDFDNNGFIDIFSEMNAEMYWNNGNGTFTGGNLSFGSGGIGDYNNDGFLDVISGNNLWINNGNSNHYVKFNLQGIVSNHSAIGARVEIYGSWGVQVREVRAGESFDPASSLYVHFGLGNSTSIDQVLIKWPSGIVTTINNPAIDQTHLILEAGCLNDAVALNEVGNVSICEGETLELTAPEGASYNWSNGATTQSISVANPGSYSVVVWDENECAAISNAVVVSYIEVENPVVSIQGDEVFCAGSSVTLVSTPSQSYLWNNGAETQELVVTESGEYSVSTSGLCSGAAYQSNVVTVQVLDAPAPVVTGATIGVPGTAILTATGENLTWYETANSPTPVGTGPSFTTDFFSEQISYWVQSSYVYGGEVGYGGKPDNTGNGGLPSTGGRLFFTVTEPFTLEQVTVYTGNSGVAGDRTIQLFDVNGNVIQSAIVACAVGTNTIDLNFELTQGSYQIGCAENNLFRNSGGLTFPYAIADVGSITGASFNSAYYYYFYNWKIRKQEIVCESPRVEVTAQVVGVDEISNAMGISIYPNPVNSVMSFSIANSSGMSVVKVLDMTGRVISSKQIVLNAGAVTQLDTQNLASGLYRLSIENKGNVSSLPFVKQ